MNTDVPIRLHACRNFAAGFTLLVLLLVLGSARVHARPLVFASLPMENRDTVIKQFMPLAGYLGQFMGREIVDLAYMGPLPSFALVGNAGTLSAEDMDGIRDALARLDPSGKDRGMLQGWGDNIRHGAVPARDEDYAPARDLLGGQFIPESGNF
jgi:ABC-type phosphate/phosphonate transport system substrate-binding protein